MYKGRGNTNFKWGFLALLSALFTAFTWIPLKFAEQSASHIDLSVILVLVIIPQIIALAFVVLQRREIANKSLILIKSLLILAIGGIIGAVSNIVDIYAVLLAPNPGYTLAVGSSYVIVVGVASKFWFKSSLNLKFALSSLIIIIGIVVINLGA